MRGVACDEDHPQALQHKRMTPRMPNFSIVASMGFLAAAR